MRRCYLIHLKKEFHLPSIFVESCDGQGWQGRIVGQENQALVGLGIFEADAAQMFGIVFGHVKPVQGDRLIADYARGPVRCTGIHAPGIHAALGARDEESTGLMQLVPTVEIDLAAIHHIEGAGLDGEQIEDVDIVHLAVADVHKFGNRAPQIEQRMHLHRCLGGSERRPIEQAQSQVDRRSVQRIDGRIQIEVQRILRVKLSGVRNQPHRQCVRDMPIA